MKPFAVNGRHPEKQLKSIGVKSSEARLTVHNTAVTKNAFTPSPSDRETVEELYIQDKTIPNNEKTCEIISTLLPKSQREITNPKNGRRIAQTNGASKVSRNFCGDDLGPTVDSYGFCKFI